VSSKSTIKWRDVADSKPGFHLYEDALDFTVESEESPVYLRLDGVEVDVSATPAGGTSVTVVLPRETARALGLLPAEEGRA
jgi:hypothetical protein